ncbi:MAG: U32 family peptidase, partial [Treponemataceae bacterium]|nr:U32 family peptidase [Treponemataceae bacterium]
GDAILNPRQAGGTGIYLGVIDRIQAAAPRAQDDATAESVSVRMACLRGGSYEPEVGDSVRLHRKDDSGRESHKVRTVQTDDKGNRWIDIPAGFSCGDSVYLLQTKAMSKRYARVLPADIGRFRRQPGAEKLPVLDLTPVEKNELSYFPAGLYMQVSTVSDMFAVQSQHPVRVILELNCETKADLLDLKMTLPFSKRQIIISLDPYCPAAAEDDLAVTLDQCIADGFTTFVANNIAHIALLRGKGVNIIAGPYLYTFNRWAVSWLENQDIGAFITPIENSYANLQATFEKNVRDRVLVTTYAYPALFRMRFKLPKSYDFTYFTDKEEMEFKVNSTPDGSFVMPEAPFSIVDKIEMLDHEGFHRVLIDFSKTKVSRGELKLVKTAMLKKLPVPETSRFNWKDGFYSPERMEEYRASNERAVERSAQSVRGGAKGNGRRGKRVP